MSRMETDFNKNPWNVPSVKEFACLKCPECAFIAREENYFEVHAITNHPLSTALFGEASSNRRYVVLKCPLGQYGVCRGCIDNLCLQRYTIYWNHNKS